MLYELLLKATAMSEKELLAFVGSS